MLPATYRELSHNNIITSWLLDHVTITTCILHISVVDIENILIWIKQWS